MIHKDTLAFLQDLKRNNTRVWFDKNETAYKFVRNDLLVLTEKILSKVSEFDENIAMAELESKKCITRINRDLRFSKDRTPYKTDFYIVLNKNGKSGVTAFYYLHIEPGNSFVGGGVYNPLPEQLRQIRKGIEANFDEWLQLINNRTFMRTCPNGVQSSGLLSKVPMGFSQDSLASEVIKNKGFFTKESLTDAEMVSSKSFARTIAHFKVAKPLIDFINKTLET